MVYLWMAGGISQTLGTYFLISLLHSKIFDSNKNTYQMILNEYTKFDNLVEWQSQNQWQISLYHSLFTICQKGFTQDVRCCANTLCYVRTGYNVLLCIFINIMHRETTSLMLSVTLVQNKFDDRNVEHSWMRHKHSLSWQPINME